MGKPKKAEVAPAQEKGVDYVPTYVLTKNHGLHVNGKANTFYEAGTTFEVEKDKDLIHQLIRSGASLQESVPPKKKAVRENKDSQNDGDQDQNQKQDDSQEKTEEE